MTKELTDIFKYLRLGGLLAHWDDYLKLAADRDFSHARFLTHVLEEEYQTQTRECPPTPAQSTPAFPKSLVIETFPFERQPKLNKKKIMALYDSLDYLHQHQNIIWLGMHRLRQDRAGHQLPHPRHRPGLPRPLRALCRPDQRTLPRRRRPLRKPGPQESTSPSTVLLIDEIGYVEVEPVQVGLFFTLMHERHKKKPTLITSNLGFSEWGSFLKNDHLTAALIDRLTENSHVFNMKGCKSLRPQTGRPSRAPTMTP